MAGQRASKPKMQEGVSRASTTAGAAEIKADTSRESDEGETQPSPAEGLQSISI